MAQRRPRCAACRLMRNICTEACIYAPFFPVEQLEKFRSVQHVFGSARVRNLLLTPDLDFGKRRAAVDSLVYEAQSRIREPLFGCVGAINAKDHEISIKDQEIKKLREEIAVLKAQLACYGGFMEQTGFEAQREIGQQHTGPLSFGSEHRWGSTFRDQQHHNGPLHQTPPGLDLSRDQLHHGFEPWRPANINSELLQALLTDTTQPSLPLPPQNGSTFHGQHHNTGPLHQTPPGLDLTRDQVDHEFEPWIQALFSDTAQTSLPLPPQDGSASR